MKARKFGGLACLKNTLVRRHLFYNQRKALSLDEVLEFQNCRCVGKRWEVYLVSVAENALSLTREKVLETERYALAWDMVRDEDWRRK